MHLEGGSSTFDVEDWAGLADLLDWHKLVGPRWGQASSRSVELQVRIEPSFAVAAVASSNTIAAKLLAPRASYRVQRLRYSKATGFE